MKKISNININNIAKAISVTILLAISVFSMAQTQVATRSTYAGNKVAILPMTYIGDGNEVRMDEMRYRLQNIAYQYLRNEAIELKFQDPSVTNALLLKNGVHEANFRQFTPGELAEILQVEYVVTGMVNQESRGMSARDNSRRVYHNNRRGRYRNEREISWHTRVREEFSTYIDVSIHNDKGEQLFSRSKHSILSSPGAYRNGLEYLLKRTPLYRK
jgi:hypothetical protein